MSGLRIAYPVQPDALPTLEQYPRLKAQTGMPQGERTELEVFRILNDAHVEYGKQLLDFLEQTIEQAPEIGTRLLKEKDPFQFSQTLAEYFLFAQLKNKFGAAVSIPTARPSEKRPDLAVSWQGLSVRFEVYSPVDFMGLQLFETYLPMVLRNLDVPCGYRLDVDITIPRSQDSLFYAYDMPDEGAVRKWFVQFAEKMCTRLAACQVRKRFRFKGPGLTIVHVTLLEKSDDPAKRLVSWAGATKSTDTRLFFEVGDAQSTANSEWGRRIKSKLNDRQCGDADANVLRVLVLNFSHADTGWPDFISSPKIATRIDETVRLLIDPTDAPYDLVLPALLGYDCRVGAPVWLTGDQALKTRGKAFLEAAGLAKPPQFDPGDQQAQIDEMTEHWKSQRGIEGQDRMALT
jgi:hypothetical protein